ncbi:toluene tolerance protein [Pseudomonas sp. RIT-PI-S]|uniref:toluene tolerance protein n=1 Tax=Pseudomonas sp. RIT-PI-S TaxID=3035295 RepID=UPI0021D7DBFE|nr:toluene tolerance protein [Pseudomonas sp. RIT-PI-S]
MQALNHPAYLALREGAEVIEADGSGDKVLGLRDGSMLKFFRRKRLVSSALLFPYAKRFASNARALHRRQVPCPEVIAVYRIPSIERDAVHYLPLAGRTVRQLFEGDAPPALRFELGQFVARLHAHGVYFRSLHLGNIVLTPDQQLGLIDIADLSCQRRPLSTGKRLRNFQHMVRYKADMHWLLADSAGSPFLEGYRLVLGDSPASHTLMPRLSTLFG